MVIHRRATRPDVGYNALMTWWTTLALAAPNPTETALTASVDPSMWQALSARHAAPCERVTATSTAPAHDLLAIVTHVTMPPWAPMRAADCLILRHADAPPVAGAMREWVADPERMGLGRLVVTRLDELDETLAVELGTRAWQAGHDRAYVERRLSQSTRSSLRAVVAPR